MKQQPQSSTQSGPISWIKRLLPLGGIVAVVAIFLVLGLDKYVTFDALALKYGQLTNMIAQQPALSFLVLVGLYAGATALSFPIAWLLSVAAGLMFGWAWGAAGIVLGATIGAVILFLAARYALADFFRARAGNILNKMAAGFRDDAVSYMLFLRLAPVFPFTLVNVVPAILGVPLLTFAWTTLIGIIPGATAYAFAGEGLRSIIGERAEACLIDVAPCGEPLSPGGLVTPQILIAFALLGGVSLLPIVLKRLRAAKS